MVDDEGVVRWLMVSHLKTLGFSRVDLAVNGAEALERLLDHRPDVVFTDFDMPVMDGAKFTAKVRVEPVFGHVPIILLTSRRFTADDWHDFGFTGYLRKPFSGTDLVAALSGVGYGLCDSRASSSGVRLMA